MLYRHLLYYVFIYKNYDISTLIILCIYLEFNYKFTKTIIIVNSTDHMIQLYLIYVIFYKTISL